MKMYYSKQNDAFYPEEYREFYVNAGTWPSDLIETSAEDFNDFGLQTPPNGKIRGFIGGVFCWADIVITEEQAQQNEISWVSLEINRVRDELEKVQDSDPYSVGTVADWRNYRKLLRVWSTNINFPNKDFRPMAPDFKE